MSEYFIYYLESSIVCFIIFGIMLCRDVFSVDRQEKQIKYDRTLVAFMLYFVSDACWAAVIAGVIPQTIHTVVITNFFNFVFMAAITYFWLDYVLAVEQMPHRNRPINRFAVLFPFLVSVLVLIITYMTAPGLLITDDSRPTGMYDAFQTGVPDIYILAVLFYTIRRAVKEKDHAARRRHLFIGFFPLMVIGGGLIQILLLPDTPIFCYCCTILMLVFYLQSMDSQISIDPLTGLNNRGQILRYLSQDSSRRREQRLTYAVMIDVNDFKDINDTFGHAEGDNALRTIAGALREAARDSGMPVFVGRFGGDEFVLVAYPEQEEDMVTLSGIIRGNLAAACRKQNLPYDLSVSIGYDALGKDEDTFKSCLRRADQKMYEDKQRQKSSRIQ